jgi:hypothetical protein
LHSILFFGRKERPEASFMTQKKRVKRRGVYWKAGLAPNSKTLNKLANTHYNANVHPFVKVIKTIASKALLVQSLQMLGILDSENFIF